MKVRSAGIELAWLTGRKARARSEMEARSAGIELAWLTGRKARAPSEMEAQRVGIELAWLDERRSYEEDTGLFFNRRGCGRQPGMV
ncbi:MAG TPA: hypothetical protein H9711_06170 [Candidatus Mediterraneibacter intestinavium]|nr:hypothetical protein [Candidatus Mediterraneibacter intestinavium]